MDGEVAFPHRDHQVLEGITDRSHGWLLADASEELGTKVGVVAKLMAEEAEGTWGITGRTVWTMSRLSLRGRPACRP
jgi:hypothetical protein